MHKGVASKLGARVRDLRQTKGLSQEEFADRVGIDRTYISGVERGVRNPTVQVLHRVARALGVSLSELFKGCD